MRMRVHCISALNPDDSSLADAMERGERKDEEEHQDENDRLGSGGNRIGRSQSHGEAKNRSRGSEQEERWH